MSKGINDGAADVRFVIDRMAQLDGDKQSFPLAGAIDLQRIAAMGHSAGAEFAARACQQDSRIRACVDLDGAMVPVAALPLHDDERMRQPLLFLEAYHPENAMGGPPDQIAEFKKVEQRQFAELRPGSYDVVLHSPQIAHPSFSDVPLLFHGQDGYPEISVALHNLDLITQFVRAFLGKTLRGEQPPLFDGRTSPVPEAVVTAYGSRPTGL
jgi:acetyl esterase/lipase